jgi:general secretion pathway protein J
MKPAPRHGLTLIETLVALLVLALMALMSRQVVDILLRSQALSQERASSLSRLQVALAQWTRDLDHLSITPYVNALEWDGRVLRLLRRSGSEDALLVVAWGLRGGLWRRWQSAPLREREVLLRVWEQAREPQAHPQDLAEASLLPVGHWQVLAWEGERWQATLSSPGRRVDLPAGLRLQLQGAAGWPGDLNLDWARATPP